MTCGRWMAAACTMTVMRRGLWKRGRRGDVHIKVSKAYAWSAPFSVSHSPSPSFLSLLDELNYLLSLLTPMTAHSRWLISSIPFVSCSDRCPLNSLSPTRLACSGSRPFSVVKSVLLSLSYHDWKKCNVSCCICCAPTVGKA
jgi:hypothetical protein